VQIVKGRHQISAGVWFQRIQDNENAASRQLGQASFASLTTFLQGTVTSFQVVPDPNELGWRSLFGAAYFEDAIKLRPNLTFQAGLRYEFTTGWNEESGRAANYITGRMEFCRRIRSWAVPPSPKTTRPISWAPARAWHGMFLETGKPRFAPATACIIP
jgi:outer membrane receptor for Fe3+-dicitrate